MLTDLCQETRNWFTPDGNIYPGKYTISSGSIAPLDFLQNGQYFRVVGSTFNDGVWQYPGVGMTDEEFDGAIWAMNVPPAFIALASRIEAWEAKYGDAVNSPFVSESIGEYSYTKGSGNANGASGGWPSAFARDLNRWRKI